MKKQTTLSTKRSTITSLALGAAIVLLAAGLLYQSTRINHLKNDLAANTSLIQRTYNAIDANAQASAPVLSPQDNRLYVPELRISLPYNEITKTLRYTYGDRDGARFYSTLITDHAVHRISCYDMVRAKHETKPDAYSPGQPHVATVGTGTPPLQLYAEQNDECATQAWQVVTPTQITDELKQAQAY
jgi:hypothetical protein